MISVKVKSEKGSAFILALMVVAAVGLLVVPVIYLATTGLRSTNLAQQRFLERYAAAHSPPPEDLPAEGAATEGEAPDEA